MSLRPTLDAATRELREELEALDALPEDKPSLPAVLDYFGFAHGGPGDPVGPTRRYPDLTCWTDAEVDALLAQGSVIEELEEFQRFLGGGPLPVSAGALALLLARLTVSEKY